MEGCDIINCSFGFAGEEKGCKIQGCDREIKTL